MSHPIIKVLNSSPIDKAARIVTSQRGCEDEYTDLSRDELLAVSVRLQRKQRLIYVALGLNKKQAQNLRTRIRAGYYTKKFDGRLAKELVRVGDNIQAVSVRITQASQTNQVPKLVRKQLGAIEAKWCEEHPGSIWDGKQRIAPNGQVFSRWAAAQSLGDHP